MSIIVLIARWKLFKKAGRKPWESLIPIHSDIVEFELGGIETYWYFLNYAVLIPIIGLFLGWIPVLVLNFWRSIALSKSFGKSTGFGVLMAFFPFLGYPILAFGNSQYIGPQTNSNTQNYSNNNFGSTNNYSNPNNNYQNFAGDAYTTQSNNVAQNYSTTNSNFSNMNQVPNGTASSQTAPNTVNSSSFQQTQSTAEPVNNNQFGTEPVSNVEPAQPTSEPTSNTQFTQHTDSMASSFTQDNSIDATQNSAGSNTNSDDLAQQTNLFDNPNV